MWRKNCLTYRVRLFCFFMLICYLIIDVVKTQNIKNNDDDDDDLADFQFDTISSKKNHGSDISKINMDYYDDNSKLDDIFLFDDNDGIEETTITTTTTKKNNGKNVFDIKEKVLRTALSKALTNKVFRQKFVEVVPILRVLSSQQRLALSALISAQINAKPGTELKLDQVKSMFGDSKKLIIPLVFDIANLIRTAAKSSFQMQYPSNKSHVSQKRPPIKMKHQEYKPQPQQQISRRNFEEIFSSSDNIPDEIIDAKQINDELYYTTRKGRLLKLVHKEQQNESENQYSRKKRSLSSSSFTNSDEKNENSKLLQNPILSTSDRTQHNRKLNISGYENDNDHILIVGPFKTKNKDNSINLNENFNTTYQTVEDLAFSDINGTETFNEAYLINETQIEELPVPESLISSRLRLRGSNKLGNGPRKPLTAQQRLSRPRKPSGPIPSTSNHVNTKCERFTPSMCIHADDYPMEQIMGSIRRHKHAMSALLAEYRDKNVESEYQEYLNNLELNKKRREDSNLVTPGGLCSSIVRYARPQKARSATGEWKYIVNTGQHTQTLRLEKCSNPQESCSYLSDNYRSRCLQVYNYHRLLSWDKTRGLHVDIFKVPTCCSCHVDGYRETFPPLINSHFASTKLNDFTSSKLNDFTSADIFKNNQQYSTISEEDDIESPEEEESEEESIAYQFSNGFKRIKPNKYDPNELFSSSSNVKNRLDVTKISKVTPTLGSYLSPPIGSFDSQLTFKRGPNLTLNKNGINNGRTRRPSLNTYMESDDRADQIISETEIGKEVTVFPSTSKPTTIRSKRIKYSNKNNSTLVPSKSISTFSSTSSTATHPAKTTSSPKAIFHSNFIKNTKGDVSKRINYNYHPIIDFFDGHATLTTSTSSSLPSPGTVVSLGKTIRNDNIGMISSKNSRIGYSEDVNDWRPVIIE